MNDVEFWEQFYPTGSFGGRIRDKAEVRRWNREWWIRLKTDVLTHYGKGKIACVKCGFDNVKALSLDHINGGGKDDRLLYGRSHKRLYIKLRRDNYPEGYQTLCMNCQFIKAADKHEFGHPSSKPSKTVLVGDTGRTG